MMSDAMALPREIGVGKDREIKILLTDRWRKLVLIQLRRGALLADHTARVPITIQTVAGHGFLRLGQETHVLSPGVLVPVDAQVLHNVQGDPDVAILVSFFRQAQAHDEPRGVPITTLS
jgi:quercetin dioxygenase-like cupin family protein